MKNGFSLVEIMVYAAVSSILLLLFSQSIYHYYHQTQKSMSRLAKRIELEHASDCLAKDLSHAQKITISEKGAKDNDRPISIVTDAGTIVWRIKKNQLIRTMKKRGALVAQGVSACIMTGLGGKMNAIKLVAQGSPQEPTIEVIRHIKSLRIV